MSSSPLGETFQGLGRQRGYLEEVAEPTGPRHVDAEEALASLGVGVLGMAVPLKIITDFGRSGPALS